METKPANRIAKPGVARTETLTRRFRHARASLAIEGLELTVEEIAVFEECIRKGCTLEERTSLLRKRFPDYDVAIRP